MSATSTKICIYSFTKGHSDTGPAGVLFSLLPQPPLIFQTLGDLLYHLQSPATAEDIIILAPKDAGELSGFLPHKRLQDRRLVVILPDTGEETLSLAHQLGPRYLCVADDVGPDLAAVLNKMATHSRLPSKGAVG